MGNGKWSPAEIEAMREFSASATCAQVGKMLGRSGPAVREKARKEGIRFGNPMLKRPDCIPSSGVLLAKTCSKCGLFLDSAMYARSKDKRYMSACKACIKVLTIDNVYRKRKKGIDYSSIANKASLSWDERKGLPWEQHEIAVLKDESKTNLERSYILKRSYNAVTLKRSRMGLGRENKTPDKDSMIWSLILTEANEQEREEFRKLGVPEDAFMWND